MSYYKIEIKCTSNVDKSGKLTVKNESDNIVIETNVVLPKSFHGQDKELRGLEVERFIPEKYSKDNNVANANFSKIYQMENVLSSHFIKTTSNDSILIVGSNECKSDGKNIKGFDEVITMPKDVFADLKKIVSNPNNDINLTVKNKWLMFGQKEVTRTYDVSFNDYRNLGKRISSEEIRIEEGIKEEQKNKALKDLELKSNVTKLDKKVSPLSEVKPANKATVNNQKKEPFVQVSTNKQQPIKKVVQNNSSSLYRGRTTQSNDDLDAFDVMLMTSFPDLAPMFRPNSALAWMIYMNNENNHQEFTKSPIDCIRNIKGFENIEACDITIKNQGTEQQSYKINLYEDEYKNVSLGTINYNPEKGLVMKDENGNKTFVSEMKDKPGYTVLTEGENNSKALIEVVQNKNNELIGNWTIEPQNSIPVTSSVVISEDLNISSDTNKTFNMDKVDNNSIFKPVEDSFIKNDSDNRWDKKEEYVPPPPPPPPPEDYNSPTSDPYARTGFSI